MRHELYRVTDLPVLQNRTFADAESAQASASADMLLVQDERSGLIFNAAFDANKLSYDADYQNEQAHSGQFQKHLSDVEGIIAVGGALELSASDDLDAVLAHQTAHPALAGADAKLVHLLGHPWSTVAAQAQAVLIADMGQEHHVTPLAMRRRAMLPGVQAAF